MSWTPGLVSRIEGNWMDVKVPTGEDCPVCPVKSVCSFEGPEKAYRTMHVVCLGGYAVGDRVEVEVPPSAIGVASLAVVLVPVLLLLIGYALHVRYTEAISIPALWAIGIGIWLAVIYMTNRMMTRSPRFEARVRGSRTRVDEGSAEETK